MVEVNTVFFSPTSGFFLCRGSVFVSGVEGPPLIVTGTLRTTDQHADKCLVFLATAPLLFDNGPEPGGHRIDDFLIDGPN